MPEFLKVKSTEEVFSILKEFNPLEAETAGLEEAAGRVLAAPVTAPEPVPHFPRSTMDGFAVRARDTFGASETLPALLEVMGEVSMGEASALTLGPGKAVSIPTGGMLPAGADAVVMVEYTYALDGTTIEVTKPVAPGDNVLKEGEDISLGEELFPAGRRLRPQDVGALAALGIGSVQVHRRPRVALISTGDEIVPVQTKNLPPGRIRDINNYTLAAQVREAGGEVGLMKSLPDDLDSLVVSCLTFLEEHDVVVVSGGSSVGARDYTVRILEYIPKSELLIHGIAIRPGKPTILARVGEKVIWGLPGQPVSAMMVFTAFVRPLLKRLQGCTDIPPNTGDADDAGPILKAVLTRKLPSVHGRTDYFPVVLSLDNGVPQATPFFGKSAMITALARSDGYVIVPEHVEGLDEGLEVAVYPFMTA